MIRRHRGREQPPGPRSPADLSIEAVPWDLDLVTPEYWYCLSGNPEKDRVQVPASVDEQLGSRPEWEVYREGIVGALLGLSEAVSEMAGKVCAAFRWEMTDHGLVTATVIVRCYERPEGPVDAELAVMTGIAKERQAGEEMAPHVSTPDLPLGPAVRRQVVVQPSAPRRSEKPPLRMMVDYWVPLEFAPTRTLGIAASTANLASASTIVPEFDEIAAGCMLRPASDAGGDPEQ